MKRCPSWICLTNASHDRLFVRINHASTPHTRMRSIAPQFASLAARAARKVPEVTVFFWIVKLLTTAMGESTSDYLVYQIDPYVAVAVACLALVVAFILQFLARRYIAWIYWLAVA